LALSAAPRNAAEMHAKLLLHLARLLTISAQSVHIVSTISGGEGKQMYVCGLFSIAASSGTKSLHCSVTSSKELNNAEHRLRLRLTVQAEAQPCA